MTVATGTGWLLEVPARPFIEAGLETRVPLAPGDRPLVEAGTAVTAGDPLLEHIREPRVEESELRRADGAEPLVAGDRRPTDGTTGRRRRPADSDGELLAPVAGHRDRWRIATGDQRDPVGSPVSGEVIEVRPGSGIRLRVGGLALRGAFGAGSAARGPLALVTDPFGDLRPGGIDVGRAGGILVVGSRIDAEALTRARAMGVRGIIVASLPGKELRDFTASERRQRAALHPTAPFGVLVLEGALRRRIPGPVADLLERLAGSEVTILVDPPALVFEEPATGLPAIDEDWVRVRSGPSAGAEGRVVGLSGLRRYAANVALESARVAIDGEAPIDIPLGDLERYT